MQTKTSHIIFSLWIIALLVFNTKIGRAQNEALRSRVVSVEQHYGTLLNIHPFFPNYKPAMNTEFSYGARTRGHKLWNQFYGYPEFGVSLSQTFLGNQDTLGNATTAMAYFGFSRQKRRFFFETKIGGGFGYFNKPFNAHDNPGNLVIGSPVTAALKLGFYFGVSLNNHWGMRFGGSFWHYSNAHFRVPNIGANVVYGSASIKYFIDGKSNSETVSHHYELPAKKINHTLMYGLGIHEIEGTVYPFDGPIYSAHQFTYYASRRLSYRGKVNLGFNYTYYNAFYDEIVSQELFDDKLKLKSSKFILVAGYEFLLGHLGLQLHSGFNLYYPIKHKQIALGLVNDSFMHKNFSHNIALNYYLKNVKEGMSLNPFFGIGLKSIGGKADFAEFRIGIGF